MGMCWFKVSQLQSLASSWDSSEGSSSYRAPVGLIEAIIATPSKFNISLCSVLSPPPPPPTGVIPHDFLW